MNKIEIPITSSPEVIDEIMKKNIEPDKIPLVVARKEDNKKEDLPASGWLEKIRLAGGKLFGTFLLTSGKVKNLIESAERILTEIYEDGQGLRRVVAESNITPNLAYFDSEQPFKTYILERGEIKMEDIKYYVRGSERIPMSKIAEAKKIENWKDTYHEGWRNFGPIRQQQIHEEAMIECARMEQARNKDAGDEQTK